MKTFCPTRWGHTATVCVELLMRLAVNSGCLPSRILGTNVNIDKNINKRQTQWQPSILKVSTLTFPIDKYPPFWRQHTDNAFTYQPRFWQGWLCKAHAQKDETKLEIMADNGNITVKDQTCLLSLVCRFCQRTKHSAEYDSNSTRTTQNPQMSTG